MLERKKIWRDFTWRLVFGISLFLLGVGNALFFSALTKNTLLNQMFQQLFFFVGFFGLLMIYLTDRRVRKHFSIIGLGFVLFFFVVFPLLLVFYLLFYMEILNGFLFFASCFGLILSIKFVCSDLKEAIC